MAALENDFRVVPVYATACLRIHLLGWSARSHHFFPRSGSAPEPDWYRGVTVTMEILSSQSRIQCPLLEYFKAISISCLGLNLCSALLVLFGVYYIAIRAVDVRGGPAFVYIVSDVGCG